MKKYLMGAIAIVMAIGLNSFSLKVDKGTNNKPVALFWYKLDNTGKVTQNLGHVDKTTLIGPVCPHTSVNICARGYNSDPSLPIGATAPIASADDLKRP
jgi:hypothetical protein